ncbi:MAG: hypothetical protein L0271_16215 [Gemmatimonadetes bacterium]|nr:hypothetical protein [Gemmatimonadota bacterium]
MSPSFRSRRNPAGRIRASSAAGIVAAAMAATLTIGCSEHGGPSEVQFDAGPETPASSVIAAVVVPAPIVSVAGVDLWPFTGSDLQGTASDPINLLFTGRADPRAIRTALMALNGDRTAFGFPPVPPFDCTWTDAFGDIQAAYSDAAGWEGNPVQLSCGPYDPIRFHLRLFPAGGATLANAHFEVLIPGTTDHQVLSWELADQLVNVDLVRTGLLGAAPASSAQINPAPGYRDIPAIIYNGLPVALRALIGGPLGNVAAPVPITTDGRATIFALAFYPTAEPRSTEDRFTIVFGQVIPRPFCTDGNQFVLVQGPVDFASRVTVSPAGTLHMHQTATGSVSVTPFDPVTGMPTGPGHQALVQDIHEAVMVPEGSIVSSLIQRRETPVTGPFTGSLRVSLRTGPQGADQYEQIEQCGS